MLVSRLSAYINIFFFFFLTIVTRDAQYGFFSPDNYLLFMAETDNITDNFIFLYSVQTNRKTNFKELYLPLYQNV